MRRSASEVIRNLENRIARLESNTSRRTKSAAQERMLTNARCIVMVEDLLMKNGQVNLCFMHMDKAILSKCVQDFFKSLNNPKVEYLIRNYAKTSSCASCVCITVEVDRAKLSESMAWLEETISDLVGSNSIPMG